MMVRLFLILLTFLSSPSLKAWNLSDVFSGMMTNATKPGSFQDAQAGYYSGGGFTMRTKRSSFQPFGLTPPSLKMGCSGIDMYMGSFSMIGGPQLVQMAKNLGTQAASYAFQLALKTFAPQIENLLSKLRDLAMELNEFGVEDCQAVQSMFASVLPKDSAMYETVCKDLEGGSGGKDYFKARENCNSREKAVKASQKAQEKDPDLLVGDYNLVFKAARKAGVPESDAKEMLSMTGTIVMKEGQRQIYESLVKDNDTWTAHLVGGKSASRYECEDKECLKIKELTSQEITQENSYQGKALKRLEELRQKMISMKAFDAGDIAFFESLEGTFPLYDYISFEAISGEHLIDRSSELVATYMLLHYMGKTIKEVRSALQTLEAKQVNDQHIKDFLLSLENLERTLATKHQDLMSKSYNMEKRLHSLEAHQLAKTRG